MNNCGWHCRVASHFKKKDFNARMTADARFVAILMNIASGGATFCGAAAIEAAILVAKTVTATQSPSGPSSDLEMFQTSLTRGGLNSFQIKQGALPTEFTSYDFVSCSSSLFFSILGAVRTGGSSAYVNCHVYDFFLDMDIYERQHERINAAHDALCTSRRGEEDLKKWISKYIFLDD